MPMLCDYDRTARELLGTPGQKLLMTHYPYDLDGICSTAALCEVLISYGVDCCIYLPHPVPQRMQDLLTEMLTHLNVSKCFIPEEDTTQYSTMTSLLLSSEQIIFIDKPSPDKLFYGDMTAQYKLNEVLETYITPDRCVLIDHRPITQPIEGIHYCVRPSAPAVSIVIFEIIEHILQQYNGPQTIDCGIFALLMTAALSDTLLLRSFTGSPLDHEAYLRLQKVCWDCNINIAHLMDKLSAYFKPTIYYNGLEVLRRRIGTYGMLHHIGFTYLEADDLVDLGFSSLLEVNDFTSNWCVDLLSEYSQLQIVCLMIQVQGNSHVIVSARPFVSLDNVRAALKGNGRHHYFRVTLNMPIREAISVVGRAFLINAKSREMYE